MKRVPQKWRGSLCWCCQNAYGNCAWSRDGACVEGWQAVRCDLPPQTKRGIPLKSFFVLQCPAFVLDGRFREEYRRFQTIGCGEPQV